MSLAARHLRVDPPTEQVERPSKAERRRRAYQLTYRWRGLRAISTYAVALALAEALVLWHVAARALALGVLATAGLSHAVLGMRKQRSVGLVFGAIAVSRLIAIALPLQSTSVVTRAGLVGLCAIFIWHRANGWLHEESTTRKHVEPGRHARPPSRVLQLNILALTTIVAIAWAYLLNDFDGAPIDDVIGPEAFAYLLAGLCLSVGALGEELVYRRLVSRMVRISTRMRIPVLSGTIWATTYIGWADAGFVVLAFVVGCVFAWLYERTGNIVGPFLAHTTINVATLLLLPALF